MRTIGVVTVARSDYGAYGPVLRRLQAEPGLQTRLFVSGMHLAPEFGLTVNMLEADGFTIAERIETLLASDTPEGVAKSIGLGVIGFAQAFTHQRPDILLVLGDRFEMYAAAVAALPFKIPVAHIHGGELTHGAMDDALRHSLTKLSHWHFVATAEYARRVAQLGEEPWRITVSGAPSLDNLHSIQWLSVPALEQRYGLKLTPPPLLVTFHPVTLELEQTEWHITELLAALEAIPAPVVFTLPNADTGHRLIQEKVAAYARTHAQVWCLDNLGPQGYFSFMRVAAAMVGNSSSGLIEAASFSLPVVNIGTRQAGRVRAANVIDVGYSRAEIQAGLYRAVSAEFRAGLHGLVNPYGDGQAAERIVTQLAHLELSQHLVYKIFQDIPGR